MGEEGHFFCIAVPSEVLHTYRTHGEATATAAAKKEDECVVVCVVVLLSFVWFPSDDASFIAPNMYNTDSNIITTNGRYVVIRLPSHPYEHDTIYQVIRSNMSPSASPNCTFIL